MVWNIQISMCFAKNIKVLVKVDMGFKELMSN